MLYVYYQKPVSYKAHQAQLELLTHTLNKNNMYTLFTYRLAHSRFPDFVYDPPDIIDLPVVISLDTMF